MRKKLIGLIQGAVGGCATYWAGLIADNLIANGVRLERKQSIGIIASDEGNRWISVKDRLPEIVGDYLVVVKYKYDFEKEYSHDTDVATYRFDGGYIDGCWDTYNDWDEGQQHLHVTHWMPLPEPPKGE